jgi:hypothetical protein
MVQLAIGPNVNTLFQVWHFPSHELLGLGKAWLRQSIAFEQLYQNINPNELLGLGKAWLRQSIAFEQLYQNINPKILQKPQTATARDTF